MDPDFIFPLKDYFHFLNGSKMTYNPSKWQHGNQNVDRREDMADILSNFQKNEEESDFGGALNVKTEYDYWQEFQYFLYKQIPIFPSLDSFS